MISFANPVPGYIHPKGWVPPAGNLDMYVFRDCADHQATNQGCALDINNGRCDGKVLAVAAGKVFYREDLQGIIRIEHTDGSRSDYAHMVPILVTVGQQVTQGQQIGEIGDAHDPSIPNFSGCHLHFAVHLTVNGPEVDPWPYMNAGGDMLGVETVTLLEGGPRSFNIPPNITLNGYDPARPGKPIVSFPSGTGSSAHADARVKVEWPGTTPAPTPNGYPFLRVVDGVLAGLLVVESYVTLAPAPPALDPKKAAHDAAAATAKGANDVAAKYP